MPIDASAATSEGPSAAKGGEDCQAWRREIEEFFIAARRELEQTQEMLALADAAGERPAISDGLNDAPNGQAAANQPGGASHVPE